MLAIEATLKGLLRALASPRCVFFLFLANLALSAIVAVPIYELFHRELANSPAARSLFADFDPVIVADFLRGQRDTFDSLSATFHVTAFVWIAVWLFLEGGVLGALAEPNRRLNLTGFFAACGRNFFPFVRGLIAPGIAFVALARLNDLCSSWLLSYFDDLRGGAASAAQLGWILVGKTLLFLLLFVLLVLMPMEFARVRAVVDDDRSMTRGYFKALGLCLRKPITITLFFVLSTALFATVSVGLDQVLQRIPLDRALTPLLRISPNFDLEIATRGLHVTLFQVAIWFTLTMLVMRTAGLLHIWRESMAPAAPQDPELVYASNRVVDAPARAPRSARRESSRFEKTTLGD